MMGEGEAINYHSQTQQHHVGDGEEEQFSGCGAILWVMQQAPGFADEYCSER
jgi:hypothetical protein